MSAQFETGQTGSHPLAPAYDPNMRTDGHEGFFHEAACYGDDEEFLKLAVPFVEDGLRAGEPTLVACAEHNTALLRGVFGRGPAVTFLHGADQYARPVDAIARYRDIFGTYAGAHQIRVIGDVPHPGTGVPWNWWARYEAAVNQAYAEFPVWGLCPYDTRITPADVLADVVRTHPNIAGQITNPRFRSGFPFSQPPTDVLQRGSALVELTDPSPAAVREAVKTAVGATTLGADGVHDAVYAASELVTNGISHGVAPVLFRLWADEERVVLTATDRGSGPADPLVGLMPTTATSSAGLGLWVLHRTCDYVSMGRDAEGFTVRVVVGGPLITG